VALLDGADHDALCCKPLVQYQILSTHPPMTRAHEQDASLRRSHKPSLPDSLTAMTWCNLSWKSVDVLAVRACSRREALVLTVMRQHRPWSSILCAWRLCRQCMRQTANSNTAQASLSRVSDRRCHSCGLCMLLD
jgi:hypothetical protein